MKPEHQAASGLDSFPTEILYLVIQLLSSAELHALCLVNKRFRLITEPFLYTQIQWTWTDSRNPPIAQFLRTIVHRPELASFVQVIVFNGDCFDPVLWEYRRKSPKLTVTKVVLDELVKCIERIRIPYAEQWIQELRAGTMDAFVTLLLSQLPCLRRLYLGKNFARESRLMGMILRSALCEESQNSHLPSFTHLKDVSVVYPDLGINIRRFTNVRNTADVLPLFYLPSVEQITTSVDNPAATFMWPWKYPPNPSKLASLDLKMLREGPLGQVLSVTQGLRKLQWEWYYRPDLKDHSVTDIIDLDQIAADLSHVQATLTDLSIMALSDLSESAPEQPVVTFRGSFRAFSGLHRLKNLEVPIPFLLGFSPSEPNVVSLEEALPKNIEWLTLTDELCLQREWEWEWEFEIEYLLRAVRSWLQDWKRFTPRLRGFRLLSRMTHEVQYWDNGLIEGLRDIGAQAGIQVQIIKQDVK